MLENIFASWVTDRAKDADEPDQLKGKHCTTFLSFLFAILVIADFGSLVSIGVINIIDTIRVMVSLATMYLAVQIWSQPTLTHAG